MRGMGLGAPCTSRVAALCEQRKLGSATLLYGAGNCRDYVLSEICGDKEENCTAGRKLRRDGSVLGAVSGIDDKSAHVGEIEKRQGNGRRGQMHPG